MKTLLKNCRPLCDALCGEMYSFDGCMAYLMECLGEPDAFDYLFFAGVTGDVFTPLYSRDPRRFAACLSACFCIGLATFTGLPVSTTHTKTTAIMGVGARRLRLCLRALYRRGS